MRTRWIVAAGALAASALTALVVRHVHEDVVRGSRTKPLHLGVVALDGREMQALAQHGGRQATWAPPFEADVVGWALYARTPGAVVSFLSPDGTVLERRAAGSDEIRPLFVPAGSGLRLLPSQRLTLRVDATAAELGELHRTHAVIYYVRAQ